MKRSIKILVMVFSAITALFILSQECSAQDYDYGSDAVYQALPDSSRDYIERKGITPDNNAAAEIPPQEILTDLWELLVDSAAKPIKMFASISAVILLFALLSGLKRGGSENSSETIFALVTTLTGTIIISSYLSESMSGIDTSLTSTADFMLTYIPVFAGIAAAGGQAASASVFSSVMIIVIQLLMQIVSKLLLPLGSLMLGVTAAGGLNPDLKTDKLSDGIKKIVIWGLGLIMTVFIGILSVQSTLASASDTITLRAAKFAVSTSIPIIGSAVSDALATVKGSISLLKSGMGGFGIISACTMLLPPLFNVLCYRFFLFISGIMSEMFAADGLCRIIRCGENVMSIITAIITCMFLFIVISTELLIIITGR